MLSKEDQKNIENAWTNVPKRLPRTRWWESLAIRQYLAKEVCGKDIPDGNWGMAKLLELGRTFDRAISVGGGLGHKEMTLIQAGLVNHFDIYELSKERIEKGQARAQALGLGHRVSFYYGDFFESEHNKPKLYDLVFWSGSLHHMLNTKFAVLVSCNILKDDGYFYCDEFVGKNRFQFSDEEINIANEIRSGLPEPIFYIPDTERMWNVLRKRPDLELMIKTDISEAADSENIIPSIQIVFPHASIVPLGGLIYSFALSDILTNIPEDSKLLQNLMFLDLELAKKGFNLYAFTLAPKVSI